MISATEKIRIKKKFATQMLLSESLFLFEDFRFQDEISSFLLVKDILLPYDQIFLIYFLSFENFVLVAATSFVLFSKCQLSHIEFNNIKSIRTNAHEVFAAGGTKRDIGKIRILSLSNENFFIEFDNQDDLLLFFRILGNIIILT